jgi:V8-like Glu-specific endopeptidase
LKALLLLSLIINTAHLYAAPPYIVETTDTFISNKQAEKEWQKLGNSVAAVFYNQKNVEPGMEDISNVAYMENLGRYRLPMMPPMKTLLELHYKSPVCDNFKFKNEIAAASCTAFLVAKDQVLTAGHCVPDFVVNKENPAVWHTFLANKKTSKDVEMVFHFTKGDTFSKYQLLSKKDTYTGTEILGYVVTPNYDYALIKLDREVEDITPLKVNLNYQGKLGDEFRVIGHPMGLPLTHSTSGSITDENMISKFQVHSNNSSFGGNSGSPVFLEKTQEVIGILVNGPDRGLDDFQVTKDGCVDYTVITKEEGKDESGISLIGQKDNYLNDMKILIEDALFSGAINTVYADDYALESILNGQNMSEAIEQYSLIEYAIMATEIDESAKALQFLLPYIEKIDFTQAIQVENLANRGYNIAKELLKEKFPESFNSRHDLKNSAESFQLPKNPYSAQ